MLIRAHIKAGLAVTIKRQILTHNRPVGVGQHATHIFSISRFCTIFRCLFGPVISRQPNLQTRIRHYNLRARSSHYFFVLSGFVISFVAAKKEENIRDFFVARAARIYSVAIPAVVITAVLDYLGYSIFPGAYPAGSQAWDLPAIRVVTSLLFANEFWILGIQLFSNVPYWSLNYEVWYYILFGVSFYLRGNTRYWVLAVITIVIGPKILLLLPIWWMGVFVFQSDAFAKMTISQAWVLLAMSLLGFTAYITQNLGLVGWNFLHDTLGADMHQNLGWSRQFLTDYFLGFYLMLHFAALRQLMSGEIPALSLIEKPIRYLAGATFSLYLFHQPLLWFFNSVFSNMVEIEMRYMLAVTLTFVAVFPLASVTERKKTAWMSAINRLVDAAYAFTQSVRRKVR